MTQAIVIRVSQQDIDRGERRSHCSCPVAIAIRRSASAARAVSVGPTEVGFSFEGGRYRRAPIPAALREFIRRFDLGGPANVRPVSASIQIEVPA